MINPCIMINELLLNIIKYAVPGIIGILGVCIGFRMNRNYQEKTLNRQALRVIRPTLTQLIELCIDIQYYYKLEEASDIVIKATRERHTTTSIIQKFSELRAQFEEKTDEILDIVNPKTRQLLGYVTIRAIAVQTYLPSKQAHPDFYTQAASMKFLKNEVKQLLDTLGEI